MYQLKSFTLKIEKIFDGAGFSLELLMDNQRIGLHQFIGPEDLDVDNPEMVFDFCFERLRLQMKEFLAEDGFCKLRNQN